MASIDEKLVGITPAMREGSGLVKFSEEFPDRYFDVAIAEQHSVTFAAGLACEEKKPVVAIYSTFLQRAYDQLIHDVAVQNLDIMFALDRAGLVGEDGPTHSGNYDIAYLRCIPNMMICTPSDEDETRHLLTTAYLHKGPASVRYPRGVGSNAKVNNDLEPLEIGKAKLISDKNSKAIVLNFGSLLEEAKGVADNVTGKQFLQDFIAQDKRLGSDFIGDSRESDDRFILPAQGGTIPISSLGLGSQLSNTDARTTFKNSFRATQS